MTLNRIGFEATNRCNLDCGHCLRERASSPADLDLELMERVLRQGREAYHLDRTTLTGGEAMLHPRFPEMLELIAEQDYGFSLVSNGLLVPRRLDLLKQPRIRSRLFHVSLSLESSDARINDQIRGHGSFKKTMAALVALKGADIPFVIKLTIHRHNLDRLERDILDFCYLGAMRVEVGTMLPSPDNLQSGLLPDPDQCRKAEAVIRRLADEIKTPISLAAGLFVEQRFPSCSALAMADMYVDVFGRLGLCCVLPGTRGRCRDQSETGILADLHQVDLWDAHQIMIDKVHKLQKYRVARIARGDLDFTDHFQCLFCMKYFGKLDWMEDFPDSPWHPRAEGGREQICHVKP